MRDMNYDRNSFHPTPTEMAQCLSASGWRWNPDHRAWFKGSTTQHGITEEALDDILMIHPWVVPAFKGALIDGAVGFAVNVTQTDEGMSASFKWQWEEK